MSGVGARTPSNLETTADEVTIHDLDAGYHFHKEKDGSEKGDKESTEVEVQATPSYDDPPDGGLRAWLVVLGVSRLLFQD